MKSESDPNIAMLNKSRLFCLREIHKAKKEVDGGANIFIAEARIRELRRRLRWNLRELERISRG